MREEGPIILAQSAVGQDYEAMLDVSFPVHKVFCEKNNVKFRSFRHVMRGFYPWHSCYNRIVILNNLLVSGFRGWFIHLDADAIIRFPDFDIRRYLGKRVDRALIACLSSVDAEPWDINDGVFFLNLGHELGREIVRRWYTAFAEHVSDQMLQSAAEPWRYPDGSPFPDDQHLLQMELKRHTALLEGLLWEDPMLMNHRGGRFIRQMLRAHGSNEQRLEWLRSLVSDISS
jgi:hypothetical protein